MDAPDKELRKIQRILVWQAVFGVGVLVGVISWIAGAFVDHSAKTICNAGGACHTDYGVLDAVFTALLGVGIVSFFVSFLLLLYSGKVEGERKDRIAAETEAAAALAASHETRRQNPHGVPDDEGTI